MSKTENPIGEDALRQIIAERAYELWEEHGRPSGYDLIHWRQAEQEILASIDTCPGRSINRAAGNLADGH
jgi:hypothetical protein